MKIFSVDIVAVLYLLIDESPFEIINAATVAFLAKDAVG